MSEQPWYPASWLDADGKPLPDVHECTFGEWPPCKPGDVIEPLTERARRLQRIDGVKERAELCEWSVSETPRYRIVAIRIIGRAA